jgi:hypothetical protein
MCFVTSSSSPMIFPPNNILGRASHAAEEYNSRSMYVPNTCCTRIQIYRRYIHCEEIGQTDVMLSEKHDPGKGIFYGNSENEAVMGRNF